MGYEIRIKGRLGDSLGGAFEDFTASVKPAETVRRGAVRDQSELHRLLDQIQSLGLELIEVRRVEGSAAAKPMSGVVAAMVRAGGDVRLDREQQLA